MLTWLAIIIVGAVVAYLSVTMPPLPPAPADPDEYERW